MKYLYKTGLLIIIFGLFLSACAAPSTPAPAVATEAPLEEPVVPEAVVTEESAPMEEKVLRIRLGTSDVSNMDPAFIPTVEDENVAYSVYQGLVGFKPGTYDLVNVLAETIDQSEDGLAIEFKLREGVQFHGGYGELTAEDVKFSFERIIDPEVASVYALDWAPLDNVEVTGKYTGIIHLKEVFAPLWKSTLPVQSGLIVSKKAVEEMGDMYATHPIGTGPYEFVEWVPNQKVEIVRFEEYWGEKPEYDKIIFLPILDDSAAEIAMETGELDFGLISAASIDRFEADDRFEVEKLVTPNYMWLALNTQHPKLQDINVRQAIRYAVDISSVLEAAYEGQWPRACSLIAPGILGYWEDAPCYERDVEKAKEYMTAAGLDSLDLTITVIQLEADRTAAEVIQANLAEIGINLEIIVQDSATYYDLESEGMQDRQLVYVWYAAQPDPIWFTEWFVCDQVGEWNWMNWCNTEYDQLNQDAIVELDEAKRADMYVQMQKLMDEDVIAVWVTNPTYFLAVKKGIVPSVMPTGRFLAWNFTSK
jgi:peptide/nickel transport system substrate-binding protein